MAEAIKMELREHKSSFMVYLILRILVIVMLVLQVLNQNYENVFLCILTLLLLIVPSFVQVTFKIELLQRWRSSYCFLYLQRRY